MRCTAALAFVLALGCKEKPLRLAGNHASRETAIELQSDQKIIGQFSSAHKIFFIRIVLNVPRMFRAELSPARGVDSAMALIFAGKEIIFNDQASSLGEEISPVFLPQGEAWLRIESRNDVDGLSEFNFFYRTFNPPADVELEPNDEVSQATPVNSTHATGFYDRSPDCFAYTNVPIEKSALWLTVTGVDGVIGGVKILDADKNLLTAQEAHSLAEVIQAPPVQIPENGKLFVCVEAIKRSTGQGRDFYEIIFEPKPLENKTEIEPNDQEKNGNPVSSDRLTGSLSSPGDVDVFTYKNKHDYALDLHAELIREKSSALKLSVGDKIFSESGPSGEVVENFRLEPGERILFTVQTRSKLPKGFKPIEYILAFKENELRDESEHESNDTPVTADTLLDLTQKWGFINPPGDIDYYRLSTTDAVRRSVVLESKIDCRFKFEHLRAGTVLAMKSGKAPLKIDNSFQKEDVIRLACVGQKPNPAERGYRLVITE